MDIHVIPHQHYDELWLKTPEKYAQMVTNNLRKALDNIKENPDFKFLIDQAIICEHFKRLYPQRYDELKKGILEGKIDLVGGGYVAPDLNIPSGEALIRQFNYGNRLFKKWFNKEPEILWAIDAFGQSGQMPQIAEKLGFKYYVFQRGVSKKIPSTFSWEGVDGSKIIAQWLPKGYSIHLFPPYSIIFSTEKPFEALEKILRPIALPIALWSLFCPSITLFVSTFGKHGRFVNLIKNLRRHSPYDKILLLVGGDVKMPFNWLSYLCQVYSRFSKDKMSLSTPTEYFEDLKTDLGREFPVFGELNGPAERLTNGVFPGCWSTRMEVKKSLKSSERLLYLTEVLSVLKFLEDGNYPDLTELWRLQFLNNNHDTVYGCYIDENHPIIMERYKKIEDGCQGIIKNNLISLVEGEAIFNPLPWKRIDLTERNGKLELVKALPLGFSKIEILKIKRKFLFAPQKPNLLLTPFYIVRFDKGIEIYNYQWEKISGEKFGQIRIQKDKGDAYFIFTDGPESWPEIKEIKLVETGPFRATIEMISGAKGLEIQQHLSFYLHTPRIDFVTKLKNQSRSNIRLQACLSFNLKNPKVIREIPAGFIEDGKSNGMDRWADFVSARFLRGNYAPYDNIKCVQNWLYLNDKNQGIAIFNDGLPEQEIIESTVFITLLRPVKVITRLGNYLIFKAEQTNKKIPLALELGTHEFRYAVMPIRRQKLARAAYEYLFPLRVCQGRGKFQDFSLFSISDKGTVLLALKKAEEGEGIVLRLLETEGREKEIKIYFNEILNGWKAKLTDLTEKRVIKTLSLNDRVLKYQIKPQEIVTLVLEP